MNINTQDKKSTPVTTEERLKWWLDARFGMMITWGAYSQTGGYWKRKYEGGYAEWLKFRKIPNIEYDSLVRAFNDFKFANGTLTIDLSDCGIPEAEINKYSEVIVVSD